MFQLFKKNSFNLNKKTLFYRELEQKTKNKYIFVYTYFKEIKAEKYFEWGRKAQSNTANLITLPSIYTFIKKQSVQGPKIYVLVARFLTIIGLKFVVKILGVTIQINTKWYAFFILKKIQRQYKDLCDICVNFQLNHSIFFLT